MMSLKIFVLCVHIIYVKAQYYYNPSSYFSQPYYNSFGAPGYYTGFGTSNYYGLSSFGQSFAPSKSSIPPKLPLVATNSPIPSLSSLSGLSSLSPNLGPPTIGPSPLQLPKCLPPTAKAYYLPSSSSLLKPSLNPELSLQQLPLQQSFAPQPTLPQISLPQLSLPPQSLSQSYLPQSLLQSSTQSLPLQSLPTPSYNCPFCTGTLPPANSNIPPPPTPSSVLPGLISEIPSLMDHSRKSFALSLDSNNDIPCLTSRSPPAVSTRFSLPQPPSQSLPGSIPPPIPIKSRYDLDLLDGFLSGLGF